MAKNWQEEVFELLRPHMMCSVEQRYQFLLTTNFGKKFINQLDLQGSLLAVKVSVVGLLMRFETWDEFIKEFRKLPVPEWYKTINK